jgi:prepilin-type N-terminal cleavage/methylation domain-containing protein
MKNTKNDRHGFTLIELLVVITIIAILAGILVPTIASAIKKGEIANAKATMLAIKTAVEAYRADYGKLPLWTDTEHGDSDPDPYNSRRGMIRILLADVSGHEAKNPRNTVYLSVDEAVNLGELKDPWDQEYDIWLDTNYDGKIDFDENNEIKQSVLLRSGGPDETQGNADDVHSFSFTP